MVKIKGWFCDIKIKLRDENTKKKLHQPLIYFLNSNKFIQKIRITLVTEITTRTIDANVGLYAIFIRISNQFSDIV